MSMRTLSFLNQHSIPFQITFAHTDSEDATTITTSAHHDGLAGTNLAAAAAAADVEATHG